MTANGLRADIQSLRGLAVLTVVIFHAELGWLDNGYLGVDVFFVISGYVITLLLSRQVATTGAIDLREFYRKRAWRLLPAAYVIYAATALAAIFFLARDEASDFFYQVLGGLLFAGNMVLASQTDYFAGEAALKPLLHIWSLGIEEQFYFLWPLLFCLRPVRWLPLAVGGLVLSLGLYLALHGSRPSETFFYLPTRAWQLLAGASLALAVAPLARQQWLPAPAVRNGLALLAMAGLLLLMALPLAAVHAQLLAIAATVLTLIIIACGASLFDQRLFLPLVFVGNLSYALYLVHWPLFAFARNIWLEGLDRSASLLLIGLSLLLALLLNRSVESHFRRSRQPGRATVLIFAGTGLAILLLASVSLWHSDTSRYAEIRRFNYGLDAGCAGKTRFEARPACVRPGQTQVLVWGDSNAMHLVAGFLTDPSLAVTQATKTVCPPLSFGAPLISNMEKYGPVWSGKCLSFNRSVMRWLAQADIDVVVLSSPFEVLLDERNQVLTADGERLPASSALTVRYLQRTLADIRALGKRAVVVSPPPKSSYNIGMCLEKKLRGQLLLGTASECRIRLADQANAEPLPFIRTLAAVEPVVVLHDYLCHDGICNTYEDGRFIYRDGSHLAYEGVEHLFRHYDLVAESLRLAR